jgi:hypothetical protein
MVVGCFAVTMEVVGQLEAVGSVDEVVFVERERADVWIDGPRLLGGDPDAGLLDVDTTAPWPERWPKPSRFRDSLVSPNSTSTAAASSSSRLMVEPTTCQ